MKRKRKKQKSLRNGREEEEEENKEEEEKAKDEAGGEEKIDREKKKPWNEMKDFVWAIGLLIRTNLVSAWKFPKLKKKIKKEFFIITH